jgi:hypothetical protein
MTVNQPRDRGRTPSHGFLDGPAVAALFRAARCGLPARATPPRDFAVPQGVPHSDEAKI